MCVWAEIVVRTFFFTTDLCVVIIKEKANLCLMTTVVPKTTLSSKTCDSKNQGYYFMCQYLFSFHEYSNVIASSSLHIS